MVCLYMSIYTPLFVSVARTLVHRYRMPTVVVAPVVWTGIEWIRCNFATGMAMACLSHTQFKQPLLIQVADLSGAYTLTFAMITVAAGLGVATLPWFLRRTETHKLSPKLVSVAVSVVVFGFVVAYGQYRISEPIVTLSPLVKVGIVQSSIDVVFEPPTMEEETARFEQYRDLTLAARQKWPDLGLVLWPESAFPMPELLSDLDEERTVGYFASAISDVWHAVTGYPEKYSNSIPLLTGTTTHDPARQEMFNSAVLISAPGEVTERYFKNHRVMFGEYVPFADWFPALQEMTPIGRGLTAGADFKCVDVGGVCFTPTICFETTVPHLIRHQVNELTNQQQEPDVIVNLTNDGWFFGTSCLDLHLACNVFRAVEMRKPNLVCANTGFSAEIDSSGRLLQLGKRRDVDILKAEVGSSRRAQRLSNDRRHPTGDDGNPLHRRICRQPIPTGTLRKSERRFCLLGQHRGDDGDVDDIIGGAAAG